MGFFDGLANKVQDNAARAYKQATGKDYDRDFRMYKNQYSYEQDYVLQSKWDELLSNKTVYTLAERMAIKSLMDERGLEYDNDWD